MTQYRLDRRFAFMAIGTTLLMSGLAIVAGMLLGPFWPALIGWIVGLALLGRGILLWVLPPVVARLDAEGITLGGRLTVKPVSLDWKAVTSVSEDGGRLLIDRGGDSVVVFPLAFVGTRAGELLREVYERLNTANGYRRFEPSE